MSKGVPEADEVVRGECFCARREEGGRTRNEINPRQEIEVLPEIVWVLGRTWVVPKGVPSFVRRSWVPKDSPPL
jgi:hypothetical protein